MGPYIAIVTIVMLDFILTKQKSHHVLISTSEEDDLAPLPENNDRNPMENAEETLILIQRAHLSKRRAMKVERIVSGKLIGKKPRSMVMQQSIWESRWTHAA
jgi:hypothetical protein